MWHIRKALMSSLFDLASPAVANHASAPIAFPNCKKLRAFMAPDGTDLWLSCMDVARELNHKGSKQYLTDRFRFAAKYGLDVPLQEKIPSHDWNGHSWAALRSAEPLMMLAQPNLKPFSLWLCDRSRKTGSERQALLKKVHVEVDADAIKVPIETKLLTALASCCPYRLEYQYRIDKYRLDAFIPRLNLCIQIDEHNHSGYDPEEEKQYNAVMRDHNVVCIRFNPHAKYAHPPELELVRQVWERTISPDFTSFRERHSFR